MKKICKTCGSEFSAKDCLVNLSSSYLRSRVNCFKCSPYLPLKDRIQKKESILEKRCKLCNLILPKSAFYIDKRGIVYSSCTKCKTAKLAPLSKAKKLETKQRVVNLFGSKCSRCGYSKNLASLDFHHLDPSKKDYSIKDLTLNSKSLYSELNKCILLCSNCHREEHNNIPNKGYFAAYLNNEFLREIW